MTTNKSSTHRAAITREGTYLTFRLQDEEYGIAIFKVKEIIGMMDITTIPKMPGFIKGVINLRGKVIPILDLRLKFGLESVPYNERTCIIVVEAPGSFGDMALGLVVDAVHDVANIKEDDVEDSPSFGMNLEGNFILGMAKYDSGVRILLDIAKVVGEAELADLTLAA